STGAVNPCKHLFGRGADAGNKGRPATVKPALESLVDIGDVAFGYERSRYPGAAGGLGGVVAGRLENRRRIEGEARTAQPIDHQADTIDAPTPLLVEKGEERRRVHIDEVAEDVHVQVVGHRGDFDPRHEDEAGGPTGLQRGLATSDRIVIGHAENVN